MKRPRLWRNALALLGALVAAGAFAGVADAHGPVAPIASGYLAKVGRVPAALQAKVIDGDQRMWLHVAPGATVVVLDYRGAPYLRFSRAGVEVNQNSIMYYLNQTPVAWTPPSNLTRTTSANWARVSGAHDYGWHDGRLHALATVALSPGASFAGRWSIPVVVDGRLSAISGGLWHSGRPSIMWFWPIVVLLACVLAAWRVRRPALDLLVARLLAVAALIAIAIAAAGRELHGRPTVSVFQLITFAIIVVFVAWGLLRVLFRRPRYFFFFAVAFVAIWEGVELLPTLWNGFVLTAVPALLARIAAVLCLGCGAALLLLAYRLSDHAEPEPSDGSELSDEYEGEDASAWESYA
jgi:hypothetical protein